MSVRNGLLALLGSGSMYGAQLRSEFERRTGGTWPLNVGQVYTTLDRLERDGLVEPVGPPDDEGRISYRLTVAGRQETDDWWTHPVPRDPAPRSELAIKLALAVTLDRVDVAAVVQVQRGATVRHLQELTRLKRASSGAASAAGSTDPGPGSGADLAWSLVLEHLVFAAEAEVRWLDHVETRLAQARSERPPAPEPSEPPQPFDRSQPSDRSGTSDASTSTVSGSV